MSAINQSSIPFESLLNRGNIPEKPNKESKFQKASRKAPVLKFREDNIELPDADIDNALSKILEGSDTPKIENSPKKVDAAAQMHDLEILHDILVEADVEQKPVFPLEKSASKKGSKRKVKLPELMEEPTKVELKHEATDDDTEHSKRIIVIMNYMNNKIFGEYLRKDFSIKYTVEQLNKKKIKDLDKIITQIRTICNSKSSDQGLDAALFTATSVVENTVSTRTQYNMRGWTQLLQNDQQFIEAWNLIKLERLSFARMSPEVKFAWCLATNAMGVITLNKQLEHATAQTHAAASRKTEPPFEFAAEHATAQMQTS